MPKTVVGLFENPDHVDDVVRDIEVLGFVRNAVRAVEEEPELARVMSFPRIGSEADLIRALTSIRSAGADVRGYLEGLRQGGSLVFATGPEEKVVHAADTMNRHGALGVEETTVPVPLPRLFRASVAPVRDSPITA